MKNAYEIYAKELEGIREAGTYKDERIITTEQRARIDTTTTHGVLNMCANNYLGLSNNKELIEAAKESYDKWGFGLSSVRFICGTQGIHKQLEKKLAEFVGTEDCILYSSCFDANGGLFETLLGTEDAIISDELNHASIIDGIRLCKAKRFRYKNNDMADLKAQLEAAKDCRIKLIATDGVFSMDGYIANLPAICDLADEYGALVMVDDSHAVGFMGEHGHGGSLRRYGPRGHSYRHAWQGPWRSERRLHLRKEGDNRSTQAAQQAVSFQQCACPGHMRRQLEGAGDAHHLHRPSRQGA